MPTQGRIVAAWKDALYAYMSVRVDEDNGESIEYISRVALGDMPDLPLAAQRERLLDAVRAVRDYQLGNRVSLPLSGIVNL